MSAATPETLGWQEVRRHEDDNALLGYVKPITEDADEADAAWRPLTVFGYDLAPPTTRGEAVAEVRRRGLECLLDKWYFRSEIDGEWYSCTIMEAAPGRVRVNIADFGFVIGHPDAAQWFEIENPNPEQFRPEWDRPTLG